jgi:hypothetical protein
MDIQVSKKAIDKLTDVCKKHKEENKEALERVVHIAACVSWNICPLCGESLSVYKKSRLFGWLQADRRKCSGCNSILVAVAPDWNSLYQSRWGVEN